MNKNIDEFATPYKINPHSKPYKNTLKESLNKYLHYWE